MTSPRDDDLARSLREEAARLRALADDFDARAQALESALSAEGGLLRYHEAANILRTSPDAVRKRAARGQLSRETIAGRPFVSRAQVQALASKAAAMSALSGSVSALSGCDDAEDKR